MNETKCDHKMVYPFFSSVAMCQNCGKKYVKETRSGFLLYALLIAWAFRLLEMVLNIQMVFVDHFGGWGLLFLLMIYCCYPLLVKCRLADHLVKLEPICEDDKQKTDCNQRFSILLFLLLTAVMIIIALVLYHLVVDSIWILLGIMLGLFVLTMVLCLKCFDWLVRMHLAYYTYNEA